MRYCKKCLSWKEENDFYLDRRNSTGRNPYCRSCNLAYQRAYYAANPKAREGNRLRAKARNYNLTTEQVAVLEQVNHCQICGTPLTIKNRHFDHDHSTGVIRGALCESCNWGLGNFGDSSTKLLQAIGYLAIGEIS